MIPDITCTHHVVHRRINRFAAWPANYGLWAWGREVLVVFVEGMLGEQGELHARDRRHPFRPIQARSMDGGRNWLTEAFSGYLPGGKCLSADEHVAVGLRTPSALVRGGSIPGLVRPIDFCDPETIVMAARTGLDAEAASWFYVSQDRGKCWSGPYAFVGLNERGIAARTDVVALSGRHALFLLSAAKANGKEGWAFCAETIDGGRTFRQKSAICECWNGYAIMPSTVLFTDRSLLTVLRRGRGSSNDGWLSSFASSDLGGRWKMIDSNVTWTGVGGNPASLAMLGQDRVALIYGVRRPPFGIRLRISGDRGRTWSQEATIRAGAPLRDLGYTRTVANSDGSLATVYYWNDGRERYIACSIVNVH